MDADIQVDIQGYDIDAEVVKAARAVSYTHLDVYKRQIHEKRIAVPDRL